MKIANLCNECILLIICVPLRWVCNTLLVPILMVYDLWIWTQFFPPPPPQLTQQQLSGKNEEVPLLCEPEANNCKMSTFSCQWFHTKCSNCFGSQHDWTGIFYKHLKLHTYTGDFPDWYEPIIVRQIVCKRVQCIFQNTTFTTKTSLYITDARLMGLVQISRWNNEDNFIFIDM